MKTTKQQIREICIYHSDDGTSGFLLSEKQFEKIFDLVEGEREEFKKLVEEMEQQLQDREMENKIAEIIHKMIKAIKEL